MTIPTSESAFTSVDYSGSVEADGNYPPNTIATYTCSSSHDSTVWYFNDIRGQTKVKSCVKSSGFVYTGSTDTNSFTCTKSECFILASGFYRFYLRGRPQPRLFYLHQTLVFYFSSIFLRWMHSFSRPSEAWEKKCFHWQKVFYLFSGLNLAN